MPAKTPNRVGNLRGFERRAAPRVGGRAVSDDLPFLMAHTIWRRSIRARSLLWLGVFASSVPLSLLTFAKFGGYVNDLRPTRFSPRATGRGTSNSA
jgi:hypothetical protein